MRSKLSVYSKNIELYRRLEGKHKRWRTVRRLFDLSIEDAAFYISADESHTRSALERRARIYYAILLDYENLERAHHLLRMQRMREQLSLGEAAFLLAGGDPAGPFPNKLRAARLRTGLSQGDIAHLIGTSRFMLSCYERGTCEPDVATAMSLSTLYDLPLKELFLQRVRSISTRVRKRRKMLAVWRRRKYKSV